MVIRRWLTRLKGVADLSGAHTTPNEKCTRPLSYHTPLEQTLANPLGPWSPCGSVGRPLTAVLEKKKQENDVRFRQPGEPSRHIRNPRVVRGQRGLKERDSRQGLAALFDRMVGETATITRDVSSMMVRLEESLPKHSKSST